MPGCLVTRDTLMTRRHTVCGHVTPGHASRDRHDVVTNQSEGVMTSGFPPQLLSHLSLDPGYIVRKNALIKSLFSTLISIDTAGFCMFQTRH